MAHQALQSMGFSRQEDWSGWPCPPPGDLPNLGIELASLTSLALAGRSFTTRATGEALFSTFSSGQSLIRVRLFVSPWTAAHQASLSVSNSQSLLELMSIELVMPSNHLILCRSLLLLPSIFPSIRVFSNESVLHIRWWNYWSFSISPCNEYSGLISFRIDWFDLLTVQGTLKSFFQNDSSKAPILQCSVFFLV